MKVIGITGGTGAGKSTVCEEIKKYGAEIIDCDKIARQIVEKGEPALGEIVEVFGDDILLSDGTLNRKKMGSLVFSDKKKLEMLNEITHRYIFAEMKKRLIETTADIVVLDVPLLFQCDFPFDCDVTVAVTADKETRIQRIMQRDGINSEMAEARMANQMTDEEYAALADVCFYNNGEYEKISEFVKKLCGD